MGSGRLGIAATAGHPFGSAEESPTKMARRGQAMLATLSDRPTTPNSPTLLPPAPPPKATAKAGQWEQYAFDTTEKAHIGRRSWC